MKKVYVITDMEGVAGINGWHECRPGPAGSAADFERSRRLLTDVVTFAASIDSIDALMPRCWATARPAAAN